MRRRDADKAEIEAAIQGLHARGLSTEADIKGLKKEDFPLPTFGPKLVELALNVSHGRGFQFIKCAAAAAAAFLSTERASDASSGQRVGAGSRGCSASRACAAM